MRAVGTRRLAHDRSRYEHMKVDLQLRRAAAMAVLGPDSTARFDGKPTRSAGPPGARAPEAARQQERYGGQRDTVQLREPGAVIATDLERAACFATVRTVKTASGATAG